MTVRLRGEGEERRGDDDEEEDLRHRMEKRIRCSAGDSAFAGTLI